MDSRPFATLGVLIVAMPSDGNGPTEDSQSALLPSGVGLGTPVTREETAAVS
jgi:hypothetical protein